MLLPNELILDVFKNSVLSQQISSKYKDIILHKIKPHRYWYYYAYDNKHDNALLISFNANQDRKDDPEILLAYNDNDFTINFNISKNFFHITKLKLIATDSSSTDDCLSIEFFSV